MPQKSKPYTHLSTKINIIFAVFGKSIMLVIIYICKGN